MTLTGPAVVVPATAAESDDVDSRGCRIVDWLRVLTVLERLALGVRLGEAEAEARGGVPVAVAARD